MKKIRLYVTVTIATVTLLSTSLSPQKQIEQKPVSPISQQPAGGFSDNISGQWNCGSFGIMTMKKISGGYAGHYRFTRKKSGEVVKGKVKGKVSDDNYVGRWWQSDRTGHFAFKLSIRRKTTRPTHMNGRWKYSYDENWRGDWDCVRK